MIGTVGGDELRADPALLRRRAERIGALAAPPPPPGGGDHPGGLLAAALEAASEALARDAGAQLAALAELAAGIARLAGDLRANDRLLP